MTIWRSHFYRAYEIISTGIFSTEHPELFEHHQFARISKNGQLEASYVKFSTAVNTYNSFKMYMLYNLIN